MRAVPPVRLVTTKRVSVPWALASTRAMMRSTRLQLARRRGIPVAAQRTGGSDAEDKIETLGVAEIQHFGRVLVAVSAKQEVHARPVSPNGADQAAQKAGRAEARGHFTIALAPPSMMAVHQRPA